MNRTQGAAVVGFLFTWVPLLLVGAVVTAAIRTSVAPVAAGRLLSYLVVVIGAGFYAIKATDGAPCARDGDCTGWVNGYNGVGPFVFGYLVGAGVLVIALVIEVVLLERNRRRRRRRQPG